MLELRGELRIATSEPLSRDDRRSSPRRRSQRLESVVANEILPRLLQVHARAAAPALPFEVLARALIDEDDGAARQALSRLSVACGDDVKLLHDALAPAARRLGEWWGQDACDFFAVSKGVARLQMFMAGLKAPLGDEALAPAMLMVTPPGETHRFGAEMAAELFRREGWRVERADGDLEALDTQTFDAVAVSCGCETAAKALSSFIAAIRARARGAAVILGGSLFLDHTARGQNLGADFVASDPDAFRTFTRALLKPRRL